MEVGEDVPIIQGMLFSTTPLCSCQPNLKSSYAHGTHRFPLLVTDSERTERGQESVVFFNRTRLKIKEQDRSYFDQGSFCHNHTCIMSMLGLVVNDVLSSMKPELRRVQLNMDRTRKKEKEADNFNLQWGGATFVGIRCTDNAKEHKLEGLDMMIHLAASLYLVAFQLVQMAQNFKGENLEEKLLEQRTILRQTFVEDKWKDKKGEWCQPGTKK